MQPLGCRVLDKISAIVRDEMNGIGSSEFSLPLLMTRDLWEVSGRWSSAGPELFRLQDRTGSDWCLAPTAEELFTAIVAADVSSYKQLPLRLYQLGRKYRDEIRPRFGLIRAKEFVMKDMYSFDRSEEEALQTYQDVRSAYLRIFQRLSLPVVVVSADSGNIGGNYSEEFQVPLGVGEDVLMSCDTCEYAANVEKCNIRLSDPQALKECEVQYLLTRPQDQPDTQVAVAVKIPRGRTININAVEAVAEVGELLEPVTLLPHHVPVQRQLQDASLASSSENHPSHVTSSLLLASEGDGCPSCTAGRLQASAGLEVGHIFYLGDKYAVPFQASFQQSSGASDLCKMGCFGIGVTRTMAALVEKHHDERGICWPSAVAPFEVCLFTTLKSSEAIEAMHLLYDQLKAAGIDVVIDDRALSFGQKLQDAELIGFPLTCIVGKHWEKSGLWELKRRSVIRDSLLTAEVQEIVASL